MGDVNVGGGAVVGPPGTSIRIASKPTPTCCTEPSEVNRKRTLTLDFPAILVIT